MPHRVDIAALASLLGGAEHAVVLTGAGISTESGIPDFRSNTGLWTRHDPMVVGSLATFMRDPARFWDFHRPRFDVVDSVEPNAGHRAIAELEAIGVVKALITQNIDGLHARAGSRDPIEVHGSLTSGTCLRCDETVERSVLLARADAASDGVPRCEACGFQLKSRVVLFGEAMPEAPIRRAFEHAERADVMLVVGSSLAVSPVNQLPEETVARGGRLAILTEGDTPFDDIAHVRIRARAGDVLPPVVAAIRERAAT